jgi:RNA polymerase sigma-B factor
LTDPQNTHKPSAANALFDEFLETRDPAIREKLIDMHMHLVPFFVKRFSNRSEMHEDISSVATLGLINAVDRYDPDKGAEFTTFATVTILGEIKRFFRDKTWSIKVPRRIKDINIHVTRAVEHLTKELDRPPTYEDIANYTGYTVEEILEAHEALQSYNVVSLDKEIDNTAGDGTTTLAEMVGTFDRKIEMLSDRLSLQTGLKQLKDDEKFVIFNRYFKNLSQAQIAKLMGVSQMQISRLQAQALLKLKRILSK